MPDHWKNDPQRPVFIDGKFHYYYPYNSDYNADPAANFGTEWRLATSYDGVVFADQGIAAPKKTNANYDLWSGSAVVDHDNTAGFGAGAVVMLVTQMDHPTESQQQNASGPQAQFLWYSIDGGRTSRPYGEQPVTPTADASTPATRKWCGTTNAPSRSRSSPRAIASASTPHRI